MATTHGADTLTVMQAGFRILPGREREFLDMQARMVPVGASQPGFVSVYGGPILDSDWLYFGVRFARAADMEAWQHHPQHRAVRTQAYARWWSAVYIRKWRALAPGETANATLLCETRLAVATPLAAAELAQARAACAPLARHGALPFETLDGVFEPQPWQFVGPLECEPATPAVTYSLFTQWPTRALLDAWQASAADSALAALGALTHECFVAWAETGERDGLRADRLQRQWTRT